MTAPDRVPKRYALSPEDTTSLGVIEAVADALDREPLALEPLANVIDTDSLDALFADSSTSSLVVSFEYEGLTVTVSNEGFVELRP